MPFTYSYLIIPFSQFTDIASIAEVNLVKNITSVTSDRPIAICIPPGKHYFVIVFARCSCGSNVNLTLCKRLDTLPNCFIAFFPIG